MNKKIEKLIQIVLSSLLFIIIFSACDFEFIGKDSEETSTTTSSTATTPSSDKEITAFSFTAANNPALDADVTGTIDGTNITATCPYGTDITALVATFTTTGEAVKVAGATQNSGTTANNFTNAVVYTVIAKDSSSQEYTVTVNKDSLADGTSISYNIGDIKLSMHYCSGGTFPIGKKDELSKTVSDPFWIGETEVTYQLWYTVYTWATSNGYTFANAGREGNDGATGAAPTYGNTEPATYMNWRDAMVFCNALTEYYNANNSKNLTFVYTNDSGFTTPIRTATNSYTVTTTTPGSQDAPYVNNNATGFRLPEAYEWECAARFIGGILWTAGNWASGAVAYYENEDATRNVAVYKYDENNPITTASVKSKAPNALGCYDMSGNVAEFDFDLSPDKANERIVRGGAYSNTYVSVVVSRTLNFSPYTPADCFGFRLFMSAE